MTGRRYSGEQALQAGIVDAVAEEANLVRAAADLARPLASRSKPVRGQIKQALYAEKLTALGIPAPMRTCMRGYTATHLRGFLYHRQARP
jgi:enoyl-CoA hydratase/carnithine racemase